MSRLESWRGIPMGTRVTVQRADGTRFETRTASLAFEVCGTAVIRVVSPDATDFYSLDRVSLAAPVSVPLPVPLSTAIQAPPPSEPLSFVDGPTTILCIAILACLVFGAGIAARLILQSPAPAWLCEETGLGCEWRSAP